MTSSTAKTTTTRTPRFSPAQLALLLVGLTVLALLAGTAIEHLSAAGSLSNHPVNPPCKSCF